MSTIKISTEEYEKLKRKAKRWDDLDARIAKYYPEDDEDAEGDLYDIGLAAAEAFSYL